MSAKKPIVTITIEADGETRVAVEGVAGEGCKALTRDIEKSLGKVTEDTSTREMYQRKETTNVYNRH
jgi:Protein of unknown function (DUF2997).